MAAKERAADIAAREVEHLVASAQAAAEQIKAEARREMDELRQRTERELEELRKKAEEEAEAIRAKAREDAEAELERARRKAIELDEDVRKEGARRIAEAQRAADDALEEARAISRGLRQLAETLTEQAGRILRDVQAGHRRITAELRVPASELGPAGRRRAAEAPESRLRPPGAGEAAGGDDLDVPSWLRG